MPPAACRRLLSLRFHFSVSIVSLVSAFYDSNSDGCVPVWNDLAGREREPPSLPTPAAIWRAGGKASGPSVSQRVDDAPPLSNWGKANVIRPNLMDHQRLVLQRSLAITLRSALLLLLLLLNLVFGVFLRRETLKTYFSFILFVSFFGIV